MCELQHLLDRNNLYKIGGTDHAWTNFAPPGYENRYIKLISIDSSNHWEGSTMVKMWSLIVDMKEDFRHLDNYRKLESTICMKVTPVRSGRHKGCYGIRIYGMKRNPDNAICNSILDFLFSQ